MRLERGQISRNAVEINRRHRELAAAKKNRVGIRPVGMDAVFIRPGMIGIVIGRAGTGDQPVGGGAVKPDAVVGMNRPKNLSARAETHNVVGDHGVL